MTLIDAVRANEYETVRALLDAGADVNARESHGDTALVAACRRKGNEMVTLLLD